MEQRINLLASMITIAGAVLAMSQIGELNATSFDIKADVRPIIGSFFFAFAAAFTSSLCFGYAFALIHPYLEKYLGRISYVVATPIVGLFSGFQTGVVTFFFARLFELGGNATILIFVFSFCFSAAIETVFLLRNFERLWKIPLNAEFPKYSIGHAVVNMLFFGIGVIVFLADADLLPSDLAIASVLLAATFLTPLTAAAGFGLYQGTRDTTE